MGLVGNKVLKDTIHYFESINDTLLLHFTETELPNDATYKLIESK